MNLVIRIYLIVWCIMMIVLGAWGLTMISTQCKDNTLYTFLRIIIVSSAVLLTLIICHTICAKICYNGDMNTGLYFPIFIFGVSLLQLIMIISTSTKIDTCTPGKDTTTYRKFMGFCGALSAISLIYSLYKLYKYFFPEKKKKKKPVDIPDLEAKIEQRFLRIGELEKRLIKAKHSKERKKLVRRIERQREKIDKYQDKIESQIGDKDIEQPDNIPKTAPKEQPDKRPINIPKLKLEKQSFTPSSISIPKINRNIHLEEPQIDTFYTDKQMMSENKEQELDNTEEGQLVTPLNNQPIEKDTEPEEKLFKRRKRRKNKI